MFKQRTTRNRPAGTSTAPLTMHIQFARSGAAQAAVETHLTFVENA